MTCKRFRRMCLRRYIEDSYQYPRWGTKYAENWMVQIILSKSSSNVSGRAFALLSMTGTSLVMRSWYNLWFLRTIWLSGSLQLYLMLKAVGLDYQLLVPCKLRDIVWGQLFLCFTLSKLQLSTVSTASLDESRSMSVVHLKKGKDLTFKKAESIFIEI